MGTDAEHWLMQQRVLLPQISFVVLFDSVDVVLATVLGGGAGV